MESSGEPKIIHVHSPSEELQLQVSELRDRIERLEKWQSFILGIAAAVSALAGLGFGIAGLMK